jgi:hypothetical protein
VVAEHQVLVLAQAQVQVAAGGRVEVGLGHRPAVDLQPPGHQPHPLPRQPDHPLDELQAAGGALRSAAHHHQVAAAGQAVQRADRDPLPGQQRRPHAVAGDQHRLQPCQPAAQHGQRP